MVVRRRNAASPSGVFFTSGEGRRRRLVVDTPGPRLIP
jgi:hypothetical protein